MVLNRHHNFLTDLLNIYIAVSNSSLPSIFIWRFGIWTALMAVSIMTLVLQSRYIWLLAYLPVYVYLATLYLAMGWPEYRYGLPVLLAGMFLPSAVMMLHPADIKRNCDGTKR